MIVKKYFYPAVFHPEETGFSVSVPDLEGCYTQGEDMDEAVTMTQDAIGLVLEDYFSKNKPMPCASTPDTIELERGEFVVMVEFDWLAYRKRHERQAIKKTLSIPSWLNQMAEEKGINFSRVLQKALKRELGVE